MPVKLPALANERLLATLRSRLTPPRLLVLSFLILIAFGTIGLKTIPGLYVGPGLSWMDALFTATSAACVTGLIVVDTATYFTPLGQAFILLLIQLGGLGMLTFTTLVILALGRRLSLHHEALTANTAQIVPDVDFKNLVRNIVRFTLAFEAVGALLLFVLWLPTFTPTEAAWHAVFQAISAFCNAGFSTFSDSLMGFQGSTGVLGVIMGLIVLGGLGFLTLEEVHVQWRRRTTRARQRLSLHSRLVLWTTAALLVGGWLVFALLEWSGGLGHLATADRFVNSLFMSVTSRTAGFNTVDHASVSEGTNFVTIVLMSVGGSPGSTAGGMKTTTLAVLLLLAVARLTGHTVATFQARSLPEETVQRATGLFVVGFAVVTLGILLFTIVGSVPGAPNPGGFLEHMFEAVSAFNTVGLSMGATGSLSGWGKALIIVLMYVGRVGPLTFAAAIALRRRSRRSEVRYAYEDVIIG